MIQLFSREVYRNFASVAVNDDGTAKLAWGESIDVQINLQALPMSRTYRAVGKFGVRAVTQILHVADDKVFRVVDMYHSGIWDKARALERAFGAAVPEDVIARLERELANGDAE